MVITGDCPHCGIQKVAFVARYQFEVSSSKSEVHMLATCNACRKGAIFHLGLYEHTSGADLVKATGSQEKLRITVEQQWPDYQSKTPAAVPANITNFYEQGVRALKAGHWDAAGAMFRKTLDVSTKVIDPDHRDETLFKRIHLLVNNGQLTAAMGDWSHEIRLDGNDAVHGEEPETEVDAKSLRRFAEAFLTYSFTLPAMVKANRGKRTPANESVVTAAA
ncbi:DUF4145 domain-containing protein [Sphingomonas flavescens]|uniref:DUF4145 domain-containing protein n=1 Tax=Sphingomonas flavescens TaxID=3132797 RepID=UPI0028053568|nr:DUF4145 domain-containing protein [Sphingomonas limnosediminicola]